MPNKLINEKSPYLLQHAHQPVDWYPWGEEAFYKAKEEDKPVFLSIGYSTCHWCHVMARECFDDMEVADLLNKYFVSIKVDREERPDVDNVYMTFCHFMRGNCGWPLSVFMTPDKKPFFVGTYFPKRSRLGLEGFLEVIEKLSYLWINNRAEIEKTSESILKIVTQSVAENRSSEKLLEARPVIPEEILRRGYENLRKSFDPVWGGFGPAPKFPTPHQLFFLMRYYNRYGSEEALRMAERTLDGMASGGIYDQLGGGFHRYSIDRGWIVPHFEKMLYDQALIGMAYLEAWQLTGKSPYRQVVLQTVDFVLEEFLSPEGGFYSAMDADVEGEEGKYYTWTKEEIINALGPEDGEIACKYWGVEGEGNFGGRFVLFRASDRFKGFRSKESILNPFPQELEPLREKLLNLRKNNRLKPLRDDKIITAWNGLMIALCARAGRVFENSSYISVAERSASFVLSHLMDPKDFRLYRCYRDGMVTSEGFLEDYAFFIRGLLELFFSTFKADFLGNACELADRMISLFWDPDNKGFYFTPGYADELPLKSKELFDGATPSGNSMAFEVLLLLSQLSRNERYQEIAVSMLETFGNVLLQAPGAYTYFLCGIDRFLGPALEVTVFPDGSSSYVGEIIAGLNRLFLPRTIHLVSSDPGISNGRGVKTMVQICKDRTCGLPVEAESFLEKLKKSISTESDLFFCDFPD